MAMLRSYLQVGLLQKDIVGMLATTIRDLTADWSARFIANLRKELCLNRSAHHRKSHQAQPLNPHPSQRCHQRQCRLRHQHHSRLCSRHRSQRQPLRQYQPPYSNLLNSRHATFYSKMVQCSLHTTADTIKMTVFGAPSNRIHACCYTYTIAANVRAQYSL